MFNSPINGFIAATKEMFPGFTVEGYTDSMGGERIMIAADYAVPVIKNSRDMDWAVGAATRFNSLILDSNAHKVATQVLNDEIVKLRAENEELKKKMANFEHFQSVVNAITEQTCREIKEQLFSGK
jgi:hypothetical protein